MNATAIPPTIVRVLERTPRHQWNAFAVVVDDEAATARLMGRGELASWLDANDVRDLAAECLVRRVPPGALLLLHMGKEGTRFHVVGGEKRRPGVPRGQAAPARAELPPRRLIVSPISSRNPSTLESDQR